MCRIAERVVGAIGVCPDGLDGLRIRLFRIDPEWQHTSVPGKLVECVRNHAQCSGRSRIVVEPRVVPRWLLQSLGRHGFQFEGWRSMCDRELLEFSVERESHRVERSRQQMVVRLRKRRPHWLTRWADSAADRRRGRPIAVAAFLKRVRGSVRRRPIAAGSETC